MPPTSPKPGIAADLASLHRKSPKISVVVPLGIPAPTVGPLALRTGVELALGFAGEVLVNFAEGMLGNLGEMRR